MSAGKHTPGPWGVAHGLEIWNCNDTAIVADCINSRLPEYETAANARLIAAAPELLDALKKLVAYENTNFPPGPREIIPDPALDALIINAEDAIRKAEGGVE